MTSSSVAGPGPLAALAGALVLLLSACGNDAAPDLPFDLVEYTPLVSELREAVDTKDGELFRRLVLSRYGDAEFWIGGWGECGGGVRVAPLVDDNIDAILQGSRIELVAIGKSDACEGKNVAYGVVTKGWQGKVLPYTYSGEAGPSSGIFDWVFTEDTVLLVFWSATIVPPRPAFFGLAPEGPFEEVAPLPR